jgi:hypothetical protein
MMTLAPQTRKVPRFGARYIFEARIRGMLKFVWIIIAVTILNPLLYLISIGVGVGSLISHNIGPHGIDGVSYLTFIAPALLAASAIQSAQDEVVSHVPRIQMESYFLWNERHPTDRLEYCRRCFFGRNSAHGIRCCCLLNHSLLIRCDEFAPFLFGYSHRHFVWSSLWCRHACIRRLYRK